MNIKLSLDVFEAERLAETLVHAAGIYERKFTTAPDGIAEEAENDARRMRKLARKIRKAAAR